MIKQFLLSKTKNFYEDYDANQDQKPTPTKEGTADDNSYEIIGFAKKYFETKGTQDTVLPGQLSQITKNDSTNMGTAIISKSDPKFDMHDLQP